MIVAAMRQDRGLQLAVNVEARFVALVEHAPDAAWDHPAVETELTGHP
jgi:hypothetical protein